jgi:hypothetical protein
MKFNKFELRTGIFTSQGKFVLPIEIDEELTMFIKVSPKGDIKSSDLVQDNWKYENALGKMSRIC